MITVSSERIFNAHLGICQRRTMLLGTHSLAPFYLRVGHRHTRVCRGAAPDPGANGDWDAFQDQLVFPVSATNMFQEPYLQFLFLYIQVYSFDPIICFMGNKIIMF